MIEFKPMVVNGTRYAVDQLWIDGRHVGYWGTHDNAGMTLLRGLEPSESEQQAIDTACMEARGYKPEIIVQPKARGARNT